MGRRLFALLLLTVCLATGTSAQETGADQIKALRLTPSQSETIRLDGLPTEEFWELADIISDLRQQEPDEGAPATEATEVRIE